MRGKLLKAAAKTFTSRITPADAGKTICKTYFGM